MDLDGDCLQKRSGNTHADLVLGKNIQMILVFLAGL